MDWQEAREEARWIARRYYDPIGLYDTDDMVQEALLDLLVVQPQSVTQRRRVMWRAVKRLLNRSRRERYRRVLGDGWPEVVHEDHIESDELGQAMRQLPDQEFQLIGMICMGLHPVQTALRELGWQPARTSRVLVLARKRLRLLMGGGVGEAREPESPRVATRRGVAVG